jgi:hypothetical protein
MTNEQHREDEWRTEQPKQKCFCCCCSEEITSAIYTNPANEQNFCHECITDFITPKLCYFLDMEFEDVIKKLEWKVE